MPTPLQPFFVCRRCGLRGAAAGPCPADGSPMVATHDELLGREIGRFRLAATIGEGGMGRVYLGVQPAIGSLVAVKVLSDECARSPELLERFFAEARAVNLIRHENIVSVLDLAQFPDGRPYIVMEYVEGSTLGSRLSQREVPLGSLVRVICEVLSALGAAHALGIVHRDLKPDNVLLTAEGHAKVLDFGIAKLAPQLAAARSPRTQTGALLGTPQYMAPEQITGAGQVDARSDLYAVGVMLFEAMTGVRPFEGKTLYDLMRAHLEQPPPSLRALRPEVPPQLEQVVQTALAKAPEQRYQSAAALAHALQQAAQELPLEQWGSLSGGPSRAGQVPSPWRVGPPSPPPQAPRATAVTPRGARRARTAWWALAAVLVLGAVGAVVAWTQLGGDGSTGASGELAALAGGAAAPAAVEGAALGAAPVGGASPSGPAGAPAGGPTRGPAGGPSPGAPEAPPAEAPAAPASDARARATGKGAAPTGTSAREPRSDAPAASAAAAADGPLIVGGGSAADHGVHVGPNVHLGPGVIIGSGSPAPADRKELVRKVDYDPRRFDPVGYLPKAQALAQALVPDAALTSFSFDPVYADGHVDLTMEGRDREYEFRSPARSARPAGAPPNLPVDRPCRVQVAVSAREVTARVFTSDECDDRLVRAPRCSFASVWRRALAAGVPADYVARVAWLSDQKWFFDTDLAGNGGGVSTFTDQCP